MIHKSRVIASAAAVLAVALASGCATTEQVEEVRVIAVQAQETANQALAAAQRAEATAQSANANATAASNKVDALEAQMNRMFRRSMLK
jgi:hypothetical protein